MPDRTTRISPGPDAVLNEGATLILAGDRRAVEAAKRLLSSGEAR
jgi:K+/H+ antiporter YhaU regulatory subunit KhtT